MTAIYRESIVLISIVRQKLLEKRVPDFFLVSDCDMLYMMTLNGGMITNLFCDWREGIDEYPHPMEFCGVYLIQRHLS